MEIFSVSLVLAISCVSGLIGWMLCGRTSQVVHLDSISISKNVVGGEVHLWIDVGNYHHVNIIAQESQEIQLHKIADDTDATDGE